MPDYEARFSHEAHRSPLDTDYWTSKAIIKAGDPREAMEIARQVRRDRADSQTNVHIDSIRELPSGMIVGISGLLPIVSPQSTQQ